MSSANTKGAIVLHGYRAKVLLVPTLAELHARANWLDSLTSFHHFRGFRKLREIAGDPFKAGVVLYDGTVGYRHHENLWARPISMLWEANT